MESKLRVVPHFFEIFTFKRERGQTSQGDNSILVIGSVTLSTPISSLLHSYSAITKGNYLTQVEDVHLF